MNAYQAYSQLLFAKAGSRGCPTRRRAATALPSG